MVDGGCIRGGWSGRKCPVTGKGPKMGFGEVDVFLGVDVGKSEHWVQAITAEGVELFGRLLGNDEAGIEAMLAEAAGAAGSGRVAVVVDMTSANARLLLGVAAARGVPVAYVTGLQMRRAAQLYAGVAKTDPRDAWVLADFARRNADRLHGVEVSDGLLASLGVLNGRDVDLAADANRSQNRCRDALLSVSPALERVLGPRLGMAGVRDLLAAWPTPTRLKAAGRARIRNRIRKRSPNKAAEVTALVWAALDAQSLVLPAEETWGEVISDLVGDLDRIQARRDELAARIEGVFLSHPLGQLLVSIPGFGTRTGSRTLAEIGDPNRFANGSRLASYAGLAPTVHRSGRTINRTSRHPGGNQRLKNAMFWAAFVAIRHDPAARAYYQRKRNEQKSHNTAIVCLARRRCDLILAILKNKTPYNTPQAA